MFPSGEGECPAGRRLIVGGSFKTELPAYCADEHKVTQQDFSAFEAERARSGFSTDRPKIPAKYVRPRKLMVLVDWNDARAYCKAHGGDLLTGDQWEKAVRGPQGGDAPHGPTDVITDEPNGWGIYDTTGNAFEWVLDDNVFKDFHGGSWCFDDAGNLRASGHFTCRAGFRFNFLGFRCGSVPAPAKATADKPKGSS